MCLYEVTAQEKWSVADGLPSSQWPTFRSQFPSSLSLVLTRMAMGPSGLVSQTFDRAIIRVSPPFDMHPVGVVTAGCLGIVALFDCLFYNFFAIAHFFCYNRHTRMLPFCWVLTSV